MPLTTKVCVAAAKAVGIDPGTAVDVNFEFGPPGHAFVVARYPLDDETMARVLDALSTIPRTGKACAPQSAGCSEESPARVDMAALESMVQSLTDEILGMRLRLEASLSKTAGLLAASSETQAAHSSPLPSPLVSPIRGPDHSVDPQFPARDCGSLE